MDVSLDDYINKSNFRIQIGNTKSNLQTGRKSGGRFQTQPITDVSVTVPAVRKQPGLQTNKTNRVRDARDKLTVKTKPNDAREKLNQKAQTKDARQKLLNIRAKKGPGTQAVDARITLQAKRQQKAVTQGPGAGETLTRTVGNSSATAGTSGAIHITRTLKCVMPPGYEDLTTPKPKTTLSQQFGGPPVQITRTVNQPPQTIIRTVPGNTQPFPLPQPQPMYPPPPTQTYPPGPVVYAGQDPPSPQVYYGQPPPPSGPQPYPYPPAQPSVQHPPPVQNFPPPPPHLQPPLVPAQYPPPCQPFVSPPYQNPPIPASGGPPYPVEDKIQITKTIGQQIGQPASQKAPEIPVIQVRNDQYHRSQPSMVYPPREPQLQQNEYYSESRAQPVLQRTVPNTSATSHTNDSPQISVHQSTIKRKAPVGGPLKLSNTNTVPVIEAPVGKSSEIAIRYSKMDEPPMKRTREEVIEPEDVISPLQGYKIVVTNLHLSVTQDDIIELFGAVGAVKRVKLVKPGLAEVAYVKRDDAVTATKTYHNRELDGMPMIVKMTTQASAKVMEAPEKLPADVKPPATGPLKLSKKPAGMAKVSEKKSVDVSTLHKALFKIGSSSSSKPVTFTVNI